MATLEADKDLLISQWRAAPRMSAMVGAIIDVWQTDFADTLDDYERMLHVDTAEGVWLDFLAIRVGLNRPLVVNPDGGDRFGFRNVDDVMSFDSAPFKGGIASAERYPLGDDVFRRFVKARGLLDTTRGDFSSFSRAVKIIDPDAQAVDNRDMTITVQTSAEGVSSRWDGTQFVPLKDIELADDIGALPRAAGIELIYEDGPRFGFEGAGEPFDTTRMR